MPLKKDEKRDGTNADGSKSEMTVTEMHVLVKNKLIEFGFPAFITSFFTKGIPKLERWKMYLPI